MRWWWIDKFTEFESGKHAKTVKCVTLAEEQLADYFPSYPVMPHSLIIEGLAQTCLLYTSPSPRDATLSRMPSSA